MTLYKKPKVVAIGGGSGVSTLLGGLKEVADVTDVVSMMDSGGSSGRLRNEHGVLPPGDILKCISELLPDDATSQKWRDLINYRFHKAILRIKSRKKRAVGTEFLVVRVGFNQSMIQA